MYVTVTLCSTPMFMIDYGYPNPGGYYSIRRIDSAPIQLLDGYMLAHETWSIDNGKDVVALLHKVHGANDNVMYGWIGDVRRRHIDQWVIDTKHHTQDLTGCIRPISSNVPIVSINTDRLA
jgi:hypothetical protein